METRPPLTKRQREVLDLIRTSVVERGYPPSIREIGEAVGLSSSSSVAHVMGVLEARGYLTRVPGSPRALSLIDDDPEPTPDQNLRVACRGLINASIAAALAPNDHNALTAQAHAWDQVALALDKAEDAARGNPW